MLAAYSFAVLDQAMRAHAPVPGEGRWRVSVPDSAEPQHAVVEAALVLLEGNGLTLAAACVAGEPIDLGASHTGHAGLLLTPSC